MQVSREELEIIQAALLEIRELRQTISGLMDQVGQKFQFVRAEVDRLIEELPPNEP
jgi:hypothetical protein